MPKDQGGMGIRNLKLHNNALMANLVAKLLSGAGGPCFSWLAQWYLNQQIPTTATRQDTPLWRSMLPLISLVQQTTRCRLGNGRSTAFWHDLWLEAGRLQLIYPILYSFASNQSCTVASQRANGSWNLKLIEPLSFTAEIQLNNLMAHLTQMTQPVDNEEDARQLITTSRTPSTSAFYNLISDRGERWNQAKWVWLQPVPKRHKVFLWLAYRGRLNTKNNMTKKCWT